MESSKWDLFRCPAHAVDSSYSEIVQAWSVFGGRDDFGPLPIAGGWLDQPAVFADVHRILSAERERLIESRRKEDERERERKARNAKGRAR